MGEFIKEMVGMLQEKMRGAELVSRVNVNFQILKSSVDTFIGRTAHIQLIENKVLLKMLMSHFNYLF
jgi:hypothetical protein